VAAGVPALNAPMPAPLPADADVRIAVIGLGYVGLPLAVAFARHWPVLGFDTNRARVEALRQRHDQSGEVSAESWAAADVLTFTTDAAELAACNVFIITVPTPIDAWKRPDLGALEAASRSVGRAITRGGVVVYESTVYPGVTEEVCIPMIERESGLKLNHDFSAGYSPERINPGDQIHRLENIVKITSGSSPEAADYIDALYARIITAGTHKVSSIRVAEATKVIENTQRDVNIALLNELAMMFHKLDIDTGEVLSAAGTKWNFLPFRPGLVGGHCIGVDPYYLTHKAQQVDHHSELILASRRINDAMGRHVAQRVVKLMHRRGIQNKDARVLILGLAFKENCADMRNTRVIEIAAELAEYNIHVDIHDPRVDAQDALEHGVGLVTTPDAGQYDAIVLAVAHREFVDAGVDAIRAFGKQGAVLFDVKRALPPGTVDDGL